MINLLWLLLFPPLIFATSLLAFLILQLGTWIGDHDRYASSSRTRQRSLWLALAVSSDMALIIPLALVALGAATLILYSGLHWLG